LSVPLRHLLNVLFLADHHLAEKVIRDAGNGLNHPWGHGELEISSLRGLRPPAHESFRITEGSVPLRSVGHRLVVDQLNHALLIFRSEYREYRGSLADSPDPFGSMIGLRVALVIPIPVRRRCFRVNGGAALGLGR